MAGAPTVASFPSLTNPASSAAGQCQASALGSPCGAGATLVQPEFPNPVQSVGAGNPVHLGSGNRHWLEHDGDGQHPLHDLLQRHYNSQDVRQGLLAAKWAFAFEVRLHRWAGGWQIIQADGSRRLFATPQVVSRSGAPSTLTPLREAQGYSCAGVEAGTGSLHLLTPPLAGDTFPESRWVWPNGQVLSFDSKGRLSQWEQPGQLPVQIMRADPSGDANHIYRISQGEHSLNFVWSLPSAQFPARLLEIRSSLGPTWRFQHDWVAGSWRLQQVSAMGSARRILYGYEPHAPAHQLHLITQRAVQQAPWKSRHLTHRQSYDRHSRVTASSYGNGTEPMRHLRIVYPGIHDAPSLRRIQHAAGELRVHVAQRDGHWQLMAQEGALCEGCIDLASGRIFDAPSRWAAALPYDLRQSVAHRWPTSRWSPTISATAESPASEMDSARVASARLRRTQVGETPLLALEQANAQTGWSAKNDELVVREQRAAQRIQRDLRLPAYLLDHRWIRVSPSVIHELLPEGGRLEWVFSEQGVLERLTWQPTNSPAQDLHTQLVESPPTWRQLDASGRLSAAPGHVLSLADRWVWDSHGRLNFARVGAKVLRPPKLYDAQGRALVHRGWHLEYGSVQGRLARATHADGRQIEWLRDGLGRVIRRISRRAGESSQIEDYLYLGPHVQAVLRPNANGQMRVWRRIVRLGMFPIALIEYSPEASRIFHVQSDSAGLPIALRDTRGRLAYRARYGGFGQLIAEQRASNLEPIAWRYPGHWADAATGWHENHARVFDPELGEYLQPDPIGPHRLTHPYAYAAHQPWRFADPWGALLIAFDGTGQDDRGLTQTNILHMTQLYGNQQSGGADPIADQTLYVRGVGTDGMATTNIANQLFAFSVTRILDETWEQLLGLLAGHDGRSVIPIDIVGYSRGAALSRIFANRIQDHMLARGRLHVVDHRNQVRVDTCLQLRFMGLFDTVAQFGLPGEDNAPHDFSIHPDWQRVAHAVAMHEDRALFPLHSLYGSYHLDQVVERGFLGNHADIGGGYHIDPNTLLPSEPAPNPVHMPGADPPPNPDAEFNPLHWTGGDLSNVTLQWMMRQAQSTGLQWFSLPQNLQSVSVPVMHRANGLLDTVVNDFKGVGHGRTIYDYHGKYFHPAYIEIVGNSWTSLSAAQRQTLLDLVTPIESGACCSAFGWVDMPEYEAWLDTHLGDWRMP